MNIRDKNLKALLPSVMVSSMGDWIFHVALLLYLFRGTQSGVIVSLFILSSTLPSLLLSPLIVKKISHFANRTTLVSADLLRMVLVASLVLFQDAMTAVFIVNAFLGVVSVAFRSAYIRKITDLYEPDQRHQVNALLNSGSYIAMGLGSVAGAALISQWSLSVCLWIDAASFLLSALFLYNLQADAEGGEKEQKQSPTLKLMLSALVTEVKGSVVLSSVLAFGLSWGIVGGAFSVLFPVLFMTQAESSGLLSTFYTVQALALLAGSFIVYKTKFKENENYLFRLFLFAYFCQAFCFSLALFTDNIYLSFIAIYFMRLCGGIIIPLDTTLIQNNSSEESLPLIYNIHGLTYNSCYQFTVLAVGIMIDSLQLSTTKAIAGWTAIVTISTICLVSLVLNSRRGVANTTESG
ncbi:Major Facilitator Superfamily protein [Vibrio aerogenes CECT 7868]|uniref:Major Facilitator Superfamily protein n=1 Tax=Vibrio aerogenes CECT 7868 TaxID=1216006 RepID=A0A1M6ARC9_9VIBR|nr:MFS transporter [Vibrio aerogenes]SHI38763.1 Major Facilitator Superfamily protein [Vibrio aerogenes CECT 7868]